MTEVLYCQKIVQDRVYMNINDGIPKMADEDPLVTKVIKINRDCFEPEEMAEAAALLRTGRLVAFPTETVYGLGANALDETAAKRIYAAKGRPSDNPLIVHIAEMSALYDLTEEVPEVAVKLGEKFWPGPLTMILRKSNRVPSGTTGGLQTVAIRLPADPIARELIRQSGVYVAAPSANASGRPSTTTAQHVYEDLSGRIDMIIDGGPVSIGLESTIVDLTGDTPMILRPGYITKEQLETVLGTVVYDKAVIAKQMQENIVAKAPGMKYRHYAPKGEMVIYEGPQEAVVTAINAEIEKRLAQSAVVGVLATDETEQLYVGGHVRSIGSRKDEDSIAAHLYKTLRDFDEIGADYIYSESFDDNPLSSAIMNRLRKAAGYHTITIK